MIKYKNLEYCVRTLHSNDMPLIEPCLDCSFRGSNRVNKKHLTHEADDCAFHNAHIKYCEANNINLNDPDNFGIIFKCVIN